MENLRNLSGSISLTGIGMAIEIVFYLFSGSLRTGPSVPGPETMGEVMRAAEKAGLYARSDRHDGLVIHRLVVSDRPIDYLRANLVRFGVPNHHSWRGTVAVSWDARPNTANFDADCSTVWGDMFVYGDPAIIRRLTGNE
jgi:hypothetical protein